MRPSDYGRRKMAVKDISEFFKDSKKRKWFYVILLFLFSLIFFNSLISTTNLLDNIHYISNMEFNSYSRMEMWQNYKDLPMWSPYFYGGHPLLAVPEEPMFDLVFVFIVIFRNIYLAINLSVIFYFFLAGLGMFLLVDYFKDNPEAAFISSIVYMFNGFMLTFVVTGHINILESYALIPFAVLFAVKAIKHESWKGVVRNSIFSGLMLGLQVLGGGIIFFLYANVIVWGFLVFNLIGKGFKNKIKRTVIVASIILAIILGISAIKLLPTLSFVKISSRAAEVQFSEFIGTENWLTPDDFVPFAHPGFMKIGIIGVVLVLFSLYSIKNRNVIYFWLVGILAFLLIGSSFFQNIFYNYVPGFHQMRNIERALIFFVFSASILAAYGYENMLKKLKSFKGLNLSPDKTGKWIVFSIVVVLILGEMVLVQWKTDRGLPRSVSFTEQLSHLEVMNYVGSETAQSGELFRIYNMAQKTIIGASGYHYYVHEGIQSTKGGGGIWINDYIQYLNIAESYNLPKLLSMLNVRYIIIDNPLNVTGFSFVKKFDQCEICTSWEADGPYLYKNENYLPRFFNAENYIMLLGNKGNVDKTAYSLALSNQFNPEKTVLLEVTSQEEFDSMDSKEFGGAKAIIMIDTELVQENTGRLGQYESSGGVLLPNIFAGENSINQTKLDSALNSENEDTIVIVNPLVYEPQRIEINLNGEKGLLGINEKFYMFPDDWTASINGNEKRILQINAINSAVMLNGEKGILVLEYKPKSYIRGKWISSVTLALIIMWFIYEFAFLSKGRRKKNKKIKESNE